MRWGERGTEGTERDRGNGGGLWACPLEDSGSGSSLQLRALITGLAGFPLRSVTRPAQTADNLVLVDRIERPNRKCWSPQRFLFEWYAATLHVQRLDVPLGSFP